MHGNFLVNVAIITAVAGVIGTFVTGVQMVVGVYTSNSAKFLRAVHTCLVLCIAICFAGVLLLLADIVRDALAH